MSKKQNRNSVFSVKKLSVLKHDLSMVNRFFCWLTSKHFYKWISSFKRDLSRSVPKIAYFFFLLSGWTFLVVASSFNPVSFFIEPQRQFIILETSCS